MRCFSISFLISTPYSFRTVLIGYTRVMTDHWSDVPGKGSGITQGGRQARQLLKAHAIGITAQRLAVLEYLKERPGHPDAEAVYEAMAARGTVISLASVYNTLRLFASKGLVAPLELDEHSVRFDAELTPHGHFRCTSCGVIRNFAYDAAALPAAELAGCRIARRDVHFHGICENCLEQNKEEPHGEKNG